MSVRGSYLFLIIIAAAAALIVFVAVRAYNRRLDRIASGELHDTHSSVPEPGTAVGAVYRTVLMAIVVVLLLTVSAMNGRLSALQNTAGNLQSNVNHLEMELSTLRAQAEQSLRRVTSSSTEILSTDWASRTAEVEFSAELREYASDTAVTLFLNGREIPLSQVAPGMYRARFTAGLFEKYDLPTICVTEGGRTVVEDSDFPETLFWDYLPMPGFSCQFSSDVVMGKLKYDGSYMIDADHTEDIESVMLTYLSGGRALKTLDLTAETLTHQTVVLEQGLQLDKDLTFLTEIVTKSGFRIVEQSTMIYEASPDFEDSDFLRILDQNGNVVWEENYGKS